LSIAVVATSDAASAASAAVVAAADAAATAVAKLLQARLSRRMQEGLMRRKHFFQVFLPSSAISFCVTFFRLQGTGRLPLCWRQLQTSSSIHFIQLQQLLSRPSLPSPPLLLPPLQQQMYLISFIHYCLIVKSSNGSSR